jgi:hypothetical protein
VPRPRLQLFCPAYAFSARSRLVAPHDREI